MLLTFKSIQNLNLGKILVEAVEILIKKFHLYQRALGKTYELSEYLVAVVTKAF
jgi:hypothetical protein